MIHALLIAVFLLPGFLQVEASEQAPKDSEVVNTAKSWAALVAAADVTRLETLLQKDYRHTHGTGRVEDKAQFLEALRSGSRKYERCEMTELDVILLGQGAVVQGILDVKAVTTERTLEVINRFMMVIAKTDRGLEVVAFQATPLEKTK